MRRSSAALLAVAAATLLVPTSPAPALTVTLDPVSNPMDFVAWVSRPPLPGPLLFGNPSGVPSSGSLELPPGLLPPYILSLGWDLAETGVGLDFGLARPDANEVSVIVTATLRFSLDQTVGYSLDGAFDVVDPGTYPSQFGATLRDLTSSSTLYGYFGSYICCDGRPLSPELHYVLSEEPQEVPDEFVSGSLQGALLAGHDYELRISGNLYALDGADLGILATGTGFVNLRFVPEPVTAVLWLLGLFALVRGPAVR